MAETVGEEPTGTPTPTFVEGAQATLDASGSNRHSGGEKEWEEATEKPHKVDEQGGPESALDVEESKTAAARAHTADEELPAKSRRLGGGLISATGMAIVVGALGWSVYWLLVPIALIASLTADLRKAGKAARATSVEAAMALASVGAVGSDELVHIGAPTANAGDAHAGAAHAGDANAVDAADGDTADGDAAADTEIEIEIDSAVEVAVEFETEVDVDLAPVVAEVSVEEDLLPTTASEWWFGTRDAPAVPPAAAAPVRALAERLTSEGREALARIQAQLGEADTPEQV